MTPRHLGVVAVSAEGAAISGPHAHPEVSLHTIPLADYMRPMDAGRWTRSA